MTTLLVTGSREVPGLDYLAVVDVFESVDPPPVKLICGGARGIDTFAANWARMKGIPFEIYAPDTAGKSKREAARACLARNTDLVRDATEVLAIWDGFSRGTRDTIKKASDAGKPIRVVRFTDRGFVIR